MRQVSRRAERRAVLRHNADLFRCRVGAAREPERRALGRLLARADDQLRFRVHVVEITDPLVLAPERTRSVVKRSLNAGERLNKVGGVAQRLFGDLALFQKLFARLIRVDREVEP